MIKLCRICNKEITDVKRLVLCSVECAKKDKIKKNSEYRRNKFKDENYLNKIREQNKKYYSIYRKQRHFVKIQVSFKDKNFFEEYFKNSPMTLSKYMNIIFKRNLKNLKKLQNNENFEKLLTKVIVYQDILTNLEKMKDNSRAKYFEDKINKILKIY